MIFSFCSHPPQSGGSSHHFWTTLLAARATWALFAMALPWIDWVWVGVGECRVRPLNLHFLSLGLIRGVNRQ